MPLDVERCRGILPRGGTILGSSRTNPYKVDGGVEQVPRPRSTELGVDALDRHRRRGHARRRPQALRQQGVHVVGVPKTIDNDLSATEVTFGFHTAVQIATDAIDRLHTTAESHDRVMVVEVMGRHAGQIATLRRASPAAPTMILVPEEPFDIDEVCERICSAGTTSGRYASIVVVAEGAEPKEGTLALQSGEIDAVRPRPPRRHRPASSPSEIESRTGFETRVTILGHVQRGGTPTAFDRVLATRFGIAAIDAVHDGAFGQMVALQGGQIVRVPLEEAVGELKPVDPELVPRRGRGVLRVSRRSDSRGELLDRGAVRGRRSARCAGGLRRGAWLAAAIASRCSP